MENEQLVSIIVPTYNYGRFIAETLDSVLAQAYPNIECIVVDDGSTDDTEEIVNGYRADDPRVIYHRQRKSGVSAARNAGIKLASGSLIQFLDADDLLESKKIAAQKRFLEANPEIDVVYGDACYFASDGGRSKSALKPVATVPLDGAGEKVVSKLLEDNIFVISAPLLRASLLKSLGGFQEGMQHLEDWEFWLRCALGGAYFRYLDAPDTKTLIRRHGQSLSADSGKMIRANFDLRMKLLASLSDTTSIGINTHHLTTTRILLAYKTIESGRCLAGFKELLTACLPGMRLKSCLYGIYLMAKRAKASR